MGNVVFCVYSIFRAIYWIKHETKKIHDNLYVILFFKIFVAGETVDSSEAVEAVEKEESHEEATVSINEVQSH